MLIKLESYNKTRLLNTVLTNPVM